MSLKLFYTNAPVFDGPQTDKDKSLGGLISSTEIPNGLIGNLFGDLSIFTIQQNKKEIRAFVIKNTAGTTKTGLKAWFTYPEQDSIATNDCTFEIGYGAVEADDCGNLGIEQLTSIYATPYNVTLHTGAEGEENALDLPDLTSGSYLGIFIRRTLNSALQQPATDDQLLAILDGTTVLPTQEDIQLTFAWD